ncbi:NAD-dependent epimerase/dehydratase family protein [Candidatus Nomurabacteria bacterium]|nr:NAD-dependent epimerase/dehydratase family protein [Candidatus Nomurabacteria bacterium]
MSKCLVLGANGFIGSHIVDRLVDDGHLVRAFDRYDSQNTIFIDSENIERFSGDFLNKKDIEQALEGIDYVFHFISTTNPASAENNPLIDVDTNIKHSILLFQACIKMNIKRLIFASTGGAIYGEGANPHIEVDTPLPVSPYAIGKLTIEHYLRYFRVKHGLDSVVLRISNPYGERQPFRRKQGVIPIFLENIAAGKSLPVMGDGTMVRDYIYVKDVANMTVNLFNKKVLHDTYNIGSGKGESLNELIDIIGKITNKEITIEHHPVPSTFVDHVVLNTNRYTKEFGPTNMTNLSEGIKLTYEYILKQMGK